MLECSSASANFAVIDGSWNDEQRRVVWCLICKARRGLQIEISPIVASAFVILQRYFRSSDGCPYELFILMVAALFTACKASDCFRPIQVVYAELTRICQSAPSHKIRSILGERVTSQVCSGDLLEVTRAELDLLRSIDFDFAIDTPFTHFEKWKQRLMQLIPNDEFFRLCNNIIVDICLMLCSAAYLDVPPEVSAAAAAAGYVDHAVIAAKTIQWLQEVQERYGKELFELAQASISLERKKTAPRGSGN
jgi:hypothetical protein